MTLLKDSYEIVSYMLVKKETFSRALNSFLLTNVRTGSELKDIKKAYLIFFKHYYFYRKLTKELLSKVTPSLITYIGVSFLSVRYFKYVDINDVISFLKIALKNNKEKYTEEIENSLIKYKNGEDYAFKSLEKGSIEHISIIFNLPEWFIQMIMNQQDSSIAKEIFGSFKGKVSDYYIQSKLEDLESVDASDIDKLKKNSDGLFEEADDELLKKGILVKTHGFYEYIFKNELKQINKYVTLYQSEKSNFFYRFLNEYLYKNNVLNLAFESFFDNPDPIKKVTPKQIKDVFVYESTVGQLIARLNFKQDLIFYVPKSTNFEKFYYCVEYPVNFNQKDIDKLIKEQKEGIKEISSYVAENGMLVYAVETIDKKETSNIINDFLETNDDFEIVTSEFVMPTSNKKVFGYYAILKRK